MSGSLVPRSTPGIVQRSTAAPVPSAPSAPLGPPLVVQPAWEADRTPGSGGGGNAGPASLERHLRRALAPFRSRRVLWCYIEPTTTYRNIGYEQWAAGSWATIDAFVTFAAIRRLEALDGRRFRPAGPWTATVTVHSFIARPVTTRRTIRESGRRGRSADAPVVVTGTDALDVLPSTLAARLRGGEADGDQAE